MSRPASLGGLHQAARRIGLSDDLGALVDEILVQARDLIDFEHGALMLRDPRTGELSVARAYGYGRRREEILSLVLGRGEGISGWAAEHRTAVRVGDVGSDDRYVPGLETARSNLAVPLLLGSEVVGVVNVESEREHAFTVEDEELLTALGVQAALAIVAARDRARLQDRIRELDALYRISRVSNERTDLDETLEKILDIACELSGDEDCHMAFLLLEPEEDVLRVRASRGYGPGMDELEIPLGGGVTGRCAATGREVVVHDVDHEEDYIPGVPDGRSEVAVPLVVDGEVLGVLDAESRTPGAFGPEHRQTLSVIAQQAAAVIHTVRLYEETRRLAITEPLTGLHNRRFFLERLDTHLGRAERYHERLALLLFDFDYLKEVNDLHGHQTGDRALCAVADMLRASLRESDEVARIGGDEFAALILQADEAEVERLHRRIREAIGPLDFRDDQSQLLQISLSAGVAFFPEDAAEADGLLQHADEALYRAKRRGRNQIAFYDPTRPRDGERRA
ncbi:MAG TPA: sensor domain-containing diguanylate cyclase [Gemmatimonadota bacterium]|nr:sensor domain-containing diguanylate cyclase [Gemmatimonadota bacterium]